ESLSRRDREPFSKSVERYTGWRRKPVGPLGGALWESHGRLEYPQPPPAPYFSRRPRQRGAQREPASYVRGRHTAWQYAFDCSASAQGRGRSGGGQHGRALPLSEGWRVSEGWRGRPGKGHGPPAS